MAHYQILILGKANYYICQQNSASKCCLKLVELYLSRIERYTKKLSRVLTVKALFKLISLHLKNIILWPTTNKCLVNCCKVFYCRPCIHCSSLHLHEENRPFHGLWRHLGWGANTAKIIVNLWDFGPLGNPVTSLQRGRISNICHYFKYWYHSYDIRKFE